MDPGSALWAVRDDSIAVCNCPAREEGEAQPLIHPHEQLGIAA